MRTGGQAGSRAGGPQVILLGEKLPAVGLTADLPARPPARLPA
jgi:hypothetical protein